MALFPAQSMDDPVEACGLSSEPTREDPFSPRDAAVRVLLIDRSEARNSIRDLLVKSADPRFLVEEADSITAGLRRLAGGGIDIVLLDTRLRGGAGMEALGTLRSSFPEMPVVMLADARDKPWFPEALERGAKDCVVKDSVDGRLLGRAVLRHVKGA